MKISKFLIFICIVHFLTSCGRNEGNELTETTPLYSPRYSSGFEIKTTQDSIADIITIFNPWQGAKDVSSDFVIFKAANSTPLNLSSQYIKGTINKVVCMSSTHIAMLEALGIPDKIVAVSGKNYITNATIRNDKSIPDIGYEGNIDYETLISVRPDLVLLFSVNGASSMEPKLKELGIPFIYIGDYVEEDPLGKAEWIVALAEIFGEREKGEQLFKEIEGRYISLCKIVGDENLNRPKVMVNAPFLDSWFMPSTKSYVARMIEDAGGEYIYEKNTGNSSEPIDLEEAIRLVDEADYWINVGSIKNNDELKQTFPKFMDAKCVREGRVYNNNLLVNEGGGNDCYESGVVNPDLILRDMIKIFHPYLLPDSLKGDFKYYRHL